MLQLAMLARSGRTLTACRALQAHVAHMGLVAFLHVIHIHAALTVFLCLQVPTLAAAAWMIANDASTVTRLTLVPTLFFSLGFLVSAQLGLCTESLAGVRKGKRHCVSAWMPVPRFERKAF